MASQLLEALGSPLNGFLRNALIAGLLASILFGIVGTYVVTKRITYIAGAIAHCALGGIGFALFARHELGWENVDPLHGALIAALAAALLIGTVVLSRSEREDTVIGATWATGMAIGFMFVKMVRRGGVSIESWLFGDINFVSRADLWTVAALGAAVLLLVLLFHRQFVAVCFDEEFARARGINVPFFYLLLLCMSAVTVVVLVRLVGIIMVIALLTLPAAIGSRFARGLGGMMAWATILCALFLILGLEFSLRWNIIAGPSIILVAAGSYFSILLLGKIKNRPALLTRQGRQRE
ncbi:MAG: metal ABC transporter permease [Verrucomicrobiales bacterium]|nr:metal ABC transporter permease [Verrucomicrobiales bacterium]